MTVRDLIEKLSAEDPDREVVMSRDPEGNGYSPLYSYWTGIYWDGEAHLEGPLSDEDKAAGYGEGDTRMADEGKRAVFLSPTN